jgi:hypothetical protein
MRNFRQEKSFRDQRRVCGEVFISIRDEIPGFDSMPGGEFMPSANVATDSMPALRPAPFPEVRAVFQVLLARDEARDA